MPCSRQAAFAVIVGTMLRHRRLHPSHRPGISEIEREEVAMARFQYVILSRAKPGQKDEYVRWYREQHLVDVARLPGVVNARLFSPDWQKDYELGAPEYSLFTLYELETDDPVATVEGIRALAGSSGMPMTEALDKSGMIQLIGHQIAAIR
jgi:hypothetical protein